MKQQLVLVPVVIAVAFAAWFGADALRPMEARVAHQVATRSSTKVALSATVARLQPWEPFSDEFVGCGGGTCGVRATAADAAHAIVQTLKTAHLGDEAFCMTSGAVFTVTEGSASRDVDGKAVYFCCEACARFFDEHRPEVLAARG